jgi:hypothetical protein
VFFAQYNRRLNMTVRRPYAKPILAKRETLAQVAAAIAPISGLPSATPQ